MLTTAAMRKAHVRTVRTGTGRTRACECCADLRHGGARKLRRTQRRVESAAWRRDAADER